MLTLFPKVSYWGGGRAFGWFIHAVANLSFSETLKGISNTLQNLKSVELSVDKIVGCPDKVKR